MASFAIEPGQLAPNCKLTALENGQPQELSQYKGKVVYVDFWASWCSSCAQSFPFMNQLHKDLHGKGLEVIGINLDENPEDARVFLSKHPASFTQLADSGNQCPQDFGLIGMPTSYLIDRKGIVRHIQQGFRAGESETIRKTVEQLTAEPH